MNFLLPETYKLLLRTKEKASAKTFKFVWTRSGQVFTKRDEASERPVITCDSDLDKLG